MSRYKRLITLFSAATMAIASLSLGSCSKTESYSEMLRTEERSVNWWLAQHRVSAEVPADSVFEVGPNAPFYKLDEDGNVYMQVINAGTKERPKKGDKIYFRFMRTNINLLYNGAEAKPEGNADDLGTYGPSSFIFQNYDLTSTLQYGEGIQQPLYYLGYDSEVNLVLKSYNGFTEDQAECTPYVLNVRYFKAMY